MLYFSAMKRFLASLTAAAFAAVMLVLPAVHRAYGHGCACHHASHGERDAHDAEFAQGGECSICHLALTPTTHAPATGAAVAVAPLLFLRAAPPPSAVAAAPTRAPTQARAPPARG